MLKSIFARQKSGASSSPPAADSSSRRSPSAASAGDVAASTRAWAVVQVAVPPGPLGVVLDGECLVAAVIDEFSSLPDGSRGAIEAHGGVVKGSVLASVNEFEVLADRLSLLEIGNVLRDTAHVERVLRFRVPPHPDDVALPPIETPQHSEKQSLLEGKDSSSSSLVADSDVVVVAAAASPSAVSVTVLRSPSLPEADVAGAPVVTPNAKPKPKPASSDGNFVSVDVPPGPLGLNLDGAVLDRGLVLGFVALPDGSKGVLETHGGVKVGSVLVEVNGENVSKLPLAELRAKLAGLCGSTRRLVFRLPLSAKRQSELLASSSLSSSASSRPLRVAPLVKVRVDEDLAKRRQLELALVLKVDKPEIKRKECWLALDAHWMRRWVAFVAQDGPLPGPISNARLLLPEWLDRLRGELPGDPATPRDELVKTQDYRFVNPMVWCLLSELHGGDGAPLLARFVTDLAATAVDAELVAELLREPQPRAASLVQALFARCRTEFIEG